MKRHVFMEEANDGTGGATGGATDSVTASSSTAPEPTAQQQDTQNALQMGAETKTVAIPEKFHVKKEDGTIDIEASALKLAENYGNLEKRLGTGDIPPKTAGEYTITVPDELKESWNPKEDPLLNEFLKDAHAAGLTQKHVDLVMSKYMDLAPKLVNGARELSSDDCVAELKKEWKTDAQYNGEIQKAYKAATEYFGPDAESIIKELGNDPRLIRGLARIGAEISEDVSLSPPGSSSGGNTVESLMSSEAYTNPGHADHARVSKQVADHFQKKALAAEKSGSVPIF